MTSDELRSESKLKLRLSEASQDMKQRNWLAWDAAMYAEIAAEIDRLKADLREARRLLERFRQMTTIHPQQTIARDLDAFLARTSYVEQEQP